jgi:hypothetical protein
MSDKEAWKIVRIITHEHNSILKDITGRGVVVGFYDGLRLLVCDISMMIGKGEIEEYYFRKCDSDLPGLEEIKQV